jgi:hypothetical protein
LKATVPHRNPAPPLTYMININSMRPKARVWCILMFGGVKEPKQVIAVYDVIAVVDIKSLDFNLSSFKIWVVLPAFM